MKTYYVLFVVLAACSMQNVPPVDGKDGVNGMDGMPGAQGPQGPKGDKGDKGDPGSSLTITQVDGGAVVSDVDGGIAMLTVVIGPAGPKGDPGAPGMNGAPGMKGDTGAQGPVGPAPSTLTIYDADGGEVGTPLLDSQSAFSMVYSKQMKCVVQIDFEANNTWDTETVMYFTGPNCTGMSFTSISTAKPLACVHIGGTHYRVHQPVYMGSINAASRMSTSTLGDGGHTTVCDSVSGGFYGVVTEAVSWAGSTGPFTFGSN